MATELVVYRILGGSEPTSRDFMSNREKGYEARGQEQVDLSLWTGWSVYDSREGAGNLVGYYDSRRAALRDVLLTVNRHGAEAVKTLALGHDTPSGDGEVLAK